MVEIFNLVSIMEIKDELVIFITQASNHEYDLKSRGERITRESKLVKQTPKIGLIRIGGRFPSGIGIEKMNISFTT